jgi:methylthioribose-1-phosphate isomerase
MMNTNNLQINDTFQAVAWRDGVVEMLDQRILPAEESLLRLESSAAVSAAIRDMIVRGAPAIGIAAAYGVVLAAREAYARNGAGWRTAIEPMLTQLALSRPTAVNLAWAIARMHKHWDGLEGNPEAVLLEEALAIHAEDRAANLRMGEYGAEIIRHAGYVLTHCNAGALATGGYGTALGVIRSAHRRKTLKGVYAAETRPWLQGARLTAWELGKDNIPVILIADSSASYLMQLGKIDWVIVGADRIAANGDVANKIGTYCHAVAARHHGLHFMVAAPVSTIDMQTATGKDIPIEQRNASELTQYDGRIVAPIGTAAFNPVFDVTPAALIDVIVTEKGVIHNPDATKISKLLEL